MADGITVDVGRQQAVDLSITAPLVDYRQLQQKPRINGVELVGDKGADELGLASGADVDALTDALAGKAAQVDLDAEAQLRESSDAALQASIDAETAARTQADAGLQAELESATASISANTASISTKLDKVENAGTGDRVYAMSNTGSQYMQTVSTSMQANTVVRRDATGQVLVGPPQESSAAATKQYVDSAADALQDAVSAESSERVQADAAKLDKVETTSAGERVYTVSAAGGQKMLPVSRGLDGLTIVQRDSTAQVHVGMPQEGTAATPRQYVQDAVEGLQSQISGLPRPRVYYATCNTIHTTPTKVLDLEDATWVPQAGDILVCYFTAGVSGSIKLRINGTEYSTVINAEGITARHVNTSSPLGLCFAFDGERFNLSGVQAIPAAMTVDEGKEGTATTLRAMRADYLKQIIEHYIDQSLVSRPNQWPENQEVDLGNGLYGKRITGTITAGAGQRHTIQVAEGVGNIIAYGGTWGARPDMSAWYVPVSSTVVSATGNLQPYYSDLRLLAASNRIELLTVSDYARAGEPTTRYDIWVKYTKVG